ncbi:hypothetical protein K439DRAFT_254579 [Ramaria rubella]|nr:hypothetical protein K439DRAFT_254579 [Ramaria rubella]
MLYTYRRVFSVHVFLTLQKDISNLYGWIDDTFPLAPTYPNFVLSRGTGRSSNIAYHAIPYMWNFCSLALYLQEPVPEQDTFAGIHISVHKEILDYVLADEVLPQLEKHHCDISAPCTVLLTAMRKCVPLLSVCKIWKAFVASKVDARIRVGAKSGPRSESSSVALDFSLGGRYKAYQVIEKGYDKSVLNAYDYGGPNGCHEIAEVVIKVSSRLSLHENEEDVYNRLSSSDDLLLPRLIFSGKYSQETQYRGLVLTKLGPDLERLRSRCRNNRFTPRMTLAVAIQTTRLYEKLHAQGWLHCNAKTANFAIGPDIPEVNTRIYMFDFEWSRQTEPVPYNTTSLDGRFQACELGDEFDALI